MLMVRSEVEHVCMYVWTVYLSEVSHGARVASRVYQISWFVSRDPAVVKSTYRCLTLTTCNPQLPVPAVCTTCPSSSATRHIYKRASVEYSTDYKNTVLLFGVWNILRRSFGYSHTRKLFLRSFDFYGNYCTWLFFTFHVAPNAFWYIEILFFFNKN